MVKIGALAAVVLVLLSGCGCGGDDAGAPSETTSETIELKVYGIKNGQLWPVRRVVPFTESVERAALDALLESPTDQEFEEFGLRNYAVPSDGDLQGLEIEGELARVESTATCARTASGRSSSRSRSSRRSPPSRWRRRRARGRTGVRTSSSSRRRSSSRTRSRTTR